MFKAQKGKTSYGAPIGILLLDFFAPHVPGDVANHSTYNFPVKYELIEGMTFDKLLNRDKSAFDILLQAAKKLQAEGVRGITADCGFFALFQNELAAELDIPVFLSSLLQVPFINSTIGKHGKVGIISAVGKNLDDPAFLGSIGIDYDRVRVKGLENEKYFPGFGIYETGELYQDEVEKEVVKIALEHIKEDPQIKAILLECSMMPPYGKAVSEATGLPVFDFITMINYMFSGVEKHAYRGYM